jgi:hypothetical protein
MNSKEIQEKIYNYVVARNDFSAPYGILTGEYTNKKGTKYKCVTFGRCRTLDATVEIYNRNFIILRTNTFGSQVFKDINELMTVLDTI